MGGADALAAVATVNRPALTLVRRPEPPKPRVRFPEGPWYPWFRREFGPLRHSGVDTSAAYRRMVTKESPLRFAMVYLDHHLTLQDSDPPAVTFSEFHLALCRSAARLQQPMPWREAWIAPRGIGKSVWMSLVLPLWALAHGHRSFFLMFSHTEQQAMAHLQNLRMELETNKLLRDDFPELAPMKTRGARNTQTTVVSNGGTFEAVGLGATILGRRAGTDRPNLVCHQLGTLMLHEGRWVPVEEHPSYRGSRIDEGREVTVWGLPFAETVTPEHRYWAKWANGCRAKYRDATWVEAHELIGMHYIGTPIDMTQRPAPAWLESVAVDGLNRDELGRVHGAHWERQLVRPDRLDDSDFWWLVGYWWGNGHLGTPRDEGSNSTTVAVTIPDRRPDLVERLHRSVAAKIRGVQREGCATYLWSDAPLARWLRTWKKPGAGQAEKAPPAWVEQLPLRLQRALVEGYTNADGDETSDTQVRVSSIWLPSLLMLRRIQARLGVAVTIRKGPGPRRETFPRGHASWSKQKYDARWSLRQERYAFTRTHIADGMLWSKVRTVDTVPVAEFAPIKTPSSTYVTAFGLSHNCGDDIEPLEEGYSVEQRDAQLRKILVGILPMTSAKAAIGIFGTVTMYRSITHQFVIHGKGREHIDWIPDNGFTPRVFPAIIENDDGTLRSLWPDRWPLTDTHLGEHKIGTREFDLNFMLDPRPDQVGRGGGFWLPDTFQYTDPVRFNAMEYALVIDPALKTGDGHDFTAIVVVGRSHDRRQAIIEYAAHGHWSGEQIRQRIHLLAEREPDMRTLIFEENAAGAEHWADVLEPSKDLPLPRQFGRVGERVRWQWAKGHKIVRAKRALAHYERGSVFHARRFAELEEEMLRFPDPGAHDDLVDAVAAALVWAFEK